MNTKHCRYCANAIDASNTFCSLKCKFDFERDEKLLTEFCNYANVNNQTKKILIQTFLKHRFKQNG